MKKHTLLIPAVVAVFVLGILIGIQFEKTQNKNNPLAQQDRILVGGIFALSGDADSTRWGEQERIGAELAVAQINNQGGINGKLLEFIVEDFSLETPKAISAFNKLTDTDGVRFIVGPTWTEAFLALTDHSTEKEVIMITPSSSMISPTAPYAFTIWPPDAGAARGLAEKIIADGHTTLAIYALQDIWGENISSYVTQYYTELGGHVVFTETFPSKTTDFKTSIEKIKHSDAEAVYMASNITEMVSYLKQSYERELNLPFYGSDSTEDSELIHLAGDLANGIVYLLPKEARNQTFIDSFVEAYGTEPALSADEAYDAVMLLAKALKACPDENVECIREDIINTRSYPGASGTFAFNEKGEIEKDFVVKTIRNGEFVEVE